MVIWKMSRGLMMALVICAVAVGLSGCTQEGEETSGSSSGMAVIDLNAIAKRMGRDTQIADRIKTYETDLNRQLLDMQAAAKKQFDDRKTQMEANPAATQAEEETRKTELTQFEKQLNTQLARAQAEANQKAVAYRKSLVAAFREEVKPAAQAAAASLGATTVLIKQDFVLSVDPTVDITEKVVAKLVSRPAATTTR